MALLLATQRQVPEHSILDHFNKQTYLGNQYTASVASTVSTSEIPIILMSNTQVTTGNQIGTFQNLLQAVSLTAGQNVLLKMYVNPTVTANGTSVTPTNSRVAYGTAKAVTSIYSAPSVSANGSLIRILSSQALIDAKSDLLTILDGGNSILITAIASASSTSVETIVGFYEL